MLQVIKYCRDVLRMQCDANATPVYEDGKCCAGLWIVSLRVNK